MAKKKAKQINSYIIEEAFAKGAKVMIHNGWLMPFDPRVVAEPVGVVCGLVNVENCKVPVAQTNRPEAIIDFYFNPDDFTFNNDDLEEIWKEYVDQGVRVKSEAVGKIIVKYGKEK